MQARLRSAMCFCAALFSICAGTGCDLPRDPEHTLRRVQQQRRVRVGLEENPPWVIRSGAIADGAEAILVRDFAASLGAAPEWHWGAEQDHLEALEKYQLDLVIGGLDAKTPWSKKIGLTHPYYVERFMVGFPAGETPPDSLKGVAVAAREGESAAEYLAKTGARPVIVSKLAAGLPAVGPEWRLSQLGLRPSRPVLLEKKHVMAAPPGENAWLKRLQEFLASRQGRITALLQQNGGAE